ncbi:MAG: DNA-formamidopyrimidine glycosylase [Ponticaulis sp.]|nr:DNA-formamidopyrimidine glycosylase [Ponticaulis sp.]
MPELPEVETVRRGLAPYLENRLLTEVRLNRPDLRFPFAPGMTDRLNGARILRLTRRAKYILAETDRDDRLVIHLGMSGRFTIIDPKQTAENAPGMFVHAQETRPQHDHVVFRTEDGVEIVYNDPRRFGYMLMYGPKDEDPFRDVGPEPLSNEFSGPYLAHALKGRKMPIKAALLDQRIVAGLGNIYVCEALFRSGISPRRLAGNVGAKRCERLAVAVRDVLSAAIEAGGSTLRDYAHADGGLGYFQHSFDVYGRETKPCHTCSAAIQRIVQSGRSTFFCANCQS